VVTLPLAGTTVIDLTRFVSGAYATMLLASLGARVLKVEMPPDGDPYRALGPQADSDMSAIFASVNRGKESLMFDFRVPDGAAALEVLLANSDFFVHNARPGSMERYELDYLSISQRHPTIIYAAISAFGDVGPDARRGGFDLIVQAEAGVMSVTGAKATGPAKVGAPMLDIGAGLCTVTGLLAAHLERLSTGQGTQVRSSLLEFAMAAFTTIATDVLASGQSPELLGSHSSSFAPYGGFEARDGHLVLAGAGDERLWRALCNVIDRPELETDERFCDNSSRLANRAELTTEIEIALANDDVATWLSRFDMAGIPAGQARALHHVLASEQVSALNMLQESAAQDPQPPPAMGVPFRLSDQRPTLTAAPALGAHTRDALWDLEVPQLLIDRLVL